MTIDQPYHLHMNMTPTITVSKLVKISPTQVNSLQIHGYKYGRSTKQSRITKKLYSVTITQVSKINKSHKDNTQKKKKKSIKGKIHLLLSCSLVIILHHIVCPQLHQQFLSPSHHQRHVHSPHHHQHQSTIKVF